jgi:hypothetical protein
VAVHANTRGRACACVGCRALLLGQAENVIEVLQKHSPPDGLFPTQISTRTGKPVNKIVTFGGTGDSFFEYLVKAWIQVGAGLRRWICALVLMRGWGGGGGGAGALCWQSNVLPWREAVACVSVA